MTSSVATARLSVDETVKLFLERDERIFQGAESVHASTPTDLAETICVRLKIKTQPWCGRKYIQLLGQSLIHELVAGAIRGASLANRGTAYSPMQQT